MRELTELRSLLDRLQEVEADALETQDLDFKEWPSEAKQAIKQAVDIAICMANGGGGTVVLGVRDRVVGRAKAILGVPPQAEIHQLKRDIYERTAPKLTPDIHELHVPEGTGRLAGHAGARWPVALHQHGRRGNGAQGQRLRTTDRRPARKIDGRTRRRRLHRGDRPRAGAVADFSRRDGAPARPGATGASAD
jgi:hypothetical protein